MLNTTKNNKDAEKMLEDYYKKIIATEEKTKNKNSKNKSK